MTFAVLFLCAPRHNHCIASSLPYLAMTSAHELTAFIGGGNMARAILTGLLAAHDAPDAFCVVEPHAPTGQQLHRDLGVAVLPQVCEELADATTVIWAVKPQSLQAAATSGRGLFASHALHLSVAAGIRSDSLCAWLGSTRVVRAMPNTPALIGQGMTGLFAPPHISPAERATCERIMAATGQFLWVDHEHQLDAVTAVSGSGPAYVFYVLEAMVRAGVALGLSAAQAHQLATATFTGASSLAAQSNETPTTLRERVTSKGGTTHAAICALDEAGVADAFVAALGAAHQRAQELGDELGSS